MLNRRIHFDMLCMPIYVRVYIHFYKIENDQSTQTLEWIKKTILTATRNPVTLV
jgi:hypothetical protein